MSCIVIVIVINIVINIVIVIVIVIVIFIVIVIVIVIYTVISCYPVTCLLLFMFTNLLFLMTGSRALGQFSFENLVKS